MQRGRRSCLPKRLLLPCLCVLCCCLWPNCCARLEVKRLRTPAYDHLHLRQHNRSRMIVASRHDEDTSWLDLYFPEIPHVVMQIDDWQDTGGIYHSTMANRGREAMAYLQYIIDYYEYLPASIAFVHGHRSAWHLLDIVPVLQRLRWGEHGFANLRYGPVEAVDWDCGPDAQAWRIIRCNWSGGTLYPGDLDACDRHGLAADDMLRINSEDTRQIWKEILEVELGPPPPIVHAPCCAQFLVARERILARPKTFYKRLREYIIETPLPDHRTAMVFEYLWHQIFGEPPVIRPVDQCLLLFCD